METTTEIRKPKLDMAHVDGNVFSVIGAVARKLKDNGMRERADEFRAKALEADSYDAVIALCFGYVEVTYNAPDEDEDEECDECGDPIGTCDCQ